MALILPGIHSLAQHLQHLQALPEDYRPERCPHCGRARMWCHGAYTRKADRERSRSASLNPVPIPRFLCSFCYRTCSRLPECVPPRRWYLWAVQQAVLGLICAGHSVGPGECGGAALRAHGGALVAPFAGVSARASVAFV